MTAQPMPRLATGCDRAAIMVMLLAEEDATRILGQLSPDELKHLTATMCTMGEIEPNAIADAIAGFAASTEQAILPEYGRVDGVRRLLSGAVGEMRAANLLRAVAPETRETPSATFELLSWLEPDIVAELVRDETPQAIAVVLLQLDPAKAARALAALPEELHTPVMHRIASLGPVSRRALSLLEDDLAERIAQLHGAVPLTMGGIKDAAGLINQGSRSVEKRVMPGLGKLDKKLAKQIEREMFKFEHLYVLDEKMTGVLLREVDNDTLIDALRGIEEDARDNFYAAMSSRAADSLREEIDTRGRIKREEVDKAQAEIIGIAKRLVADGSIIMGEGDDDYV